MTFDDAKTEFATALGNLKRAFREENCYGDCGLTIVIDDYDYITIIPNNVTGSYTEIWRGWVDTD